MDRAAVLSALRAMPDDAMVTFPVPTLRKLLDRDSLDHGLLSVADVGRLMKRSPGAIRLYIREGRLKATKLPGSRGYLIDRADLDRFLSGDDVPRRESEGKRESRPIGTNAWRSRRRPR